MAIEETSDGSVVITGKEDIRIAALTALAYAIVTEMETGMKPTRNFSALKVARSHGLIPEGTRPHKKKILRLVVQEIRRVKPGWEPSEHLAKALTK
jgi:hypothetical protein